MLGFPKSHEAFEVQYIYIYIWVFPKIGVPQNGWCIMENPIKMDDLEVPLFLEIYIYIHIWVLGSFRAPWDCIY